MYTNVAYLHDFFDEIVDDSKDLLVTSCGYYRLEKLPIIATERPKGRKDFQLLFIAKGKGHFVINGKKEIVSEGNMILFRTDESQMYYYYGKDKTEVYWIHFTGKNVEDLLNQYDFPNNKNVFFAGFSSDYEYFYTKIIQELQLERKNYTDMISLFFKQLLIAVNRFLIEEKKSNTEIQNKVEKATHYFNEHYNEEINIDDFAASMNMSTCYFIRCFRQIVRVSPLQYILSLRMSNAKNLLGNTTYNINEIAQIVGYENQLYFSRLFRKNVGVSPSEYRKQNWNN